MSLLENWRNFAYGESQDPAASQRFWNEYFEIEKGVYKKLLSGYPEAVEGTVAELAEKYDLSEQFMVGFLDGINDSLKEANDIENMTLETTVSLGFDPEKLYYNMVKCKADWLYELPEWEPILTAERRKELYREQKKSGTVINEKKIGRNDPCPCGSGKKYKFCCGK